MPWTKPLILQELRKLRSRGADLSYNALARKRQALLSAAAYHFGSYRAAVARAGIDYSTVTRRPRWTKQAIIALIKQARRAGRDLSWSAVTRGTGELTRAAFASLQPRLFGRWDRALHAAGLDADEISRYRTWDRNTIAFELRSRRREDEPLNSGAVQRDDPALHAAAVRQFGAYDPALRAAGIPPATVRQRRRWEKSYVLSALGQPLHAAAARLFGSYRVARAQVT
jgi:hypothetical protein